MFLPANVIENPFHDQEIDYLAQPSSVLSANVYHRSARISRSASDSALQQVEQDDQLQSQSDIDLFTFVGLLGNGPSTINLLGQIMVISSKKDFSFRTNLPNATFVYVKYPDSFRATLIQLANEAYNTFLTAHSNMNAIQLNMKQIPGHVKTALKLLASAPMVLLEKLLPLSLNNIERIGIECSNLSATTHNKFADVQFLIGEINELTGYSYGITDQRLAETNIELNKTEAAKNALKEKEILIQQRYEEQAAVVRQAQQKFNKALEEIPTGMDAIKQEILGALTDTYKSFVAAKSCSNGLVKNCLADPIGTTAKNANEAAMNKAKLAMEALKLAEDQYQKTFAELMAHHDTMMQVIVQLASLDMTKIDFEQLIPILQQAIKYLSEIRVHWGKLIEFFDNLRIRVQIVQKNSFTKFVEWMRSTQEMQKDSLTQEIRTFYLDMLKEDVVGIYRESHLLYIMSKTYYDVSSEYMMSQLAGLAKMIAASSDEERNALKSQLMQDTQMVQNEISRLALQRKHEYDMANERRQEEIEQYMQEISPQLSETTVGHRRIPQKI